MYRREEYTIPDFDFIATLLNVSENEVETIETVKTDGSIRYYVSLRRKDYCCRYCGGELILHGHKERIINHPTLAGIKTEIRFISKRYICKECKKTFLEDNPFTFSGFNSSYSLLRNVLLKLKDLNYNLKMIAEDLHISETMVNNYLDSYVTVADKPRLPECMGIDELHSKVLSHKNCAYLCVIVDNERRVLNNVLGSRSKNYLENYFYSYPIEERNRVKYVTIDMWRPYLDISRKLFKNAKIAVDPFHVAEHLSKDFSSIRIKMMNQCIYGSNAYYLLKSWHWLLEKSDVDLDNEPVYNSRFRIKLNRRDIFNMILDISPVLKTAYFLKEEYLRFNKVMTYEEALDNYDVLISDFEREDIEEYREFVSILKSWREEIINSFLRPYHDRKLSNSLCENINGKIRTYINISRGITNFSRFRKRVIYALNDDVFYSLTNVLKTDKRKGRKRGEYKKGTTFE